MHQSQTVMVLHIVTHAQLTSLPSKWSKCRYPHQSDNIVRQMINKAIILNHD